MSAAGPRGRLRQRATRAVALAFLVGFVVWAVRGVDAASLSRAFAETNLTLLLLAAVANLVALAVQAWRWNVLLRPLGAARYGTSFGGMLIGFAMSSVLPARAGELARVHLVARRMRVRTASIAGSAVLDHVVNGMTIAPLALVLPLSPGLPDWIRETILIVLVVTLAGGIAAWLLAAPERPGDPPEGRVGRFFSDIRYGFVAMRSLGQFTRAASVGCLAWLLEALTTWIALMACGMGADPTVAVITLIAVNMALAIPSPPGNFGTFEVGAVIALTALGHSREQALAFALSYHLLQLVPLCLAAGVAWLVMRRRDDAALPAQPA